MSFSRTLHARFGRARPVDRAARVADALVHLLLVVIGGLVCWWTDSWLVGIPVCLVLSAVYDLFVGARVEGQVTRGQRGYDASPDGRLTRHHG